MTVFCVCGPPGGGKTWLRKRHPVLKDMPAFDIADIHQRHERAAGAGAPRLAPSEALGQLLSDIAPLLPTEHQELVVEGYFRPGGEQRST